MADNATIELYLRLNHLATEEQLLQAYASIYQIPFVRLKNRKIKPEVLRLIPEITARRYDIVAYDRQGDVVLVAISSPRRFKSEHKVGLLNRLQAELHVKIAPSLAPLEDIRACFVGYETVGSAHAVGTADQAAEATASPAAAASEAQTSQVSSTPQTPGVPIVSLVGRPLPVPVLQRFPEPVVRHYGLVAFDEPKPNHFYVAALDPTGKATQQVIDYLRRQNHVTIEVFQTDQASIAHALSLYQPQSAVHSAGATVTATNAEIVDDSAKLPSELPVTDQTEELRGKTVVIQADNLTTTTPQVTIVEAPVIKKETGELKAPAPLVTPKAPQIVPEVTADQLITSGADQSAKPATPAHEAPESSATGGVAAPAKPVNESALDAFVGIALHSVQDLVQLVRSGNVPKMVAGIVVFAVTMRASDIHIEAEKDKIRLRYRVDGELEEILMMPRVLLAPLVSRIKILSQMKIDENRVPQDGRFGAMIHERDIDLRVSTLPTVYGEKVVIRILDKTTGIMSLEDMGLDGDNLQRIITNIEKPYGIVLSTGPTGSGKSTTLYAILQRISQTTNNVVTLEDPVEYEMAGINQTQIKPKIGFTFAEGLRSILRQDPNIIMVGEIRDKETAEMATHAALTGHLVLTTLHTNSASGALPRLINMGIEPFLITSSINAVEGQRLVRRVCQKCKYEERLPQGVIDEITAELKNANVDESLKNPANWHFFRGKGCPECHNGYRGRIGIFEVLPMSETIEALAVRKEPASVIEQQAIKEGMVTMKQDGLIKAIKGLTTVEEVMKATTE